MLSVRRFTSSIHRCDVNSLYHYSFEGMYIERDSLSTRNTAILGGTVAGSRLESDRNSVTVGRIVLRRGVCCRCSA
jgi:hypothetical protein